MVTITNCTLKIAAGSHETDAYRVEDSKVSNSPLIQGRAAKAVLALLGVSFLKPHFSCSANHNKACPNFAQTIAKFDLARSCALSRTLSSLPLVFLSSLASSTKHYLSLFSSIKPRGTDLPFFLIFLHYLVLLY